MNRELRAKAVESAAARYGAEHYRGILFWQTCGKLWPLIPVVAVLGGAAWLVYTNPAASGAVSVGIVALAVLIWLMVRWVRSPYRRRRF